MGRDSLLRGAVRGYSGHEPAARRFDGHVVPLRYPSPPALLRRADSRIEPGSAGSAVELSRALIGGRCSTFLRGGLETVRSVPSAPLPDAPSCLHRLPLSDLPLQARHTTCDGLVLLLPTLYVAAKFSYLAILNAQLALNVVDAVLLVSLSFLLPSVPVIKGLDIATLGISLTNSLGLLLLLTNVDLDFTVGHRQLPSEVFVGAGGRRRRRRLQLRVCFFKLFMRVFQLSLHLFHLGSLRLRLFQPLLCLIPLLVCPVQLLLYLFQLRLLLGLWMVTHATIPRSDAGFILTINRGGKAMDR